MFQYVFLLTLLIITSCGSEPSNSDNGKTSTLCGSNQTFSSSNQTFDHTYEVGPGKTYATPNDVPWESLNPGSIIKIYYRSTPYANKWVISRAGTKTKPIVIKGIPGTGGELPVITGENATTRTGLLFTNENRGLIKIGTSNVNYIEPNYIEISNLHLKSARPAYSFTGLYTSSGVHNYSENAAAIYIELGKNITIKNCVIEDSGNGIFIGSNGKTQNILITKNYIHNNGISGSFYQHNVYSNAIGITFEYNRFGALRSGCMGNNLKDRSAGTVIRYNWMNGGNRTLDLVDSTITAVNTHSSYRNTT